MAKKDAVNKSALIREALAANWLQRYGPAEQSRFGPRHICLLPDRTRVGESS